MFELEYKTMDKNPLHLLLDERREFPVEVEKQVQALWEATPNPGRDEEKYVVKEVFEVEGREVYLMQLVNFRHIFAMLANFQNREQRRKPIIPGLHLSLANPIGKIQIINLHKGSFQTQSILGQDRDRKQLTAIGGHLDKEDFLECTLPNGMKPIVPFRSDGRLDMKSIIEMCRGMEEAEQQFAKIDCPATRCMNREGKEEVGIDCYTLRPNGKYEKSYKTPFGQRLVIENWHVYNLIPEKETTFEELKQSFLEHDRILRERNGEREFSSLEPISNHLSELMQLLESESFAQRPKRPSVEAVLRAESDHQKKLYKLQLNEVRRPSLFLSSLNPNFSHLNLNFGNLPSHKKVQEKLKAALENFPKQLPFPVKEDTTRSRN